MLNNIICYVTACTIQIVLLYGFKVLTNHKDKIYWKNMIFILLFAGIMTLENYYQLTLIQTMSSILIYFIMYYLVFRKKIKETIFYGTAIWILAAFVDFFIMLSVSLNSYVNMAVDTIIIRSLDTILMSIALILIFRIKRLGKWLRSLYQRIDKIKFPYLRVLLIFVIMFCLGILFLAIIQDPNLSKYNELLYILVLSVVILICLYFNKEYTNYTLKETNDYLIKNNEFYITVVNDYRILKHNIIHQLSGIKSVSNEEAIKLIDDLIESYNENTQSVHNIKKMPVGINGIVYEKIYNFNSKDLKLGIDNNIESNLFDNLTPRSYNLLCEALGILLDNALQATEKTVEKIIMIDMKETEYSYNIKIVNTFQDLLDLEKLGTMKYTTKNSGHGIGLFSLIGRKKLKIKTSIINDLFLNEIIIEKNK